MPRRLIIFAAVPLILMLVLAALWSGFDWPPPRLILKYGFPPTGGPTGRTMTIEGVEFVELKPGYFRMGSHFHCRRGDLLGRICALAHLPRGAWPKHDSNECPPRWAEIREAFWIARTEVTNKQYEQFAPQNKRDWPEDEDPVTSVSLEDARAYCEWLARRSGLPVRLPSEAEWEYSCRAGSVTEYSFGNCEVDLREYAWFGPWFLGGNSDRRAHTVKTKYPNSWGLFDMHGNVAEVCADPYHLEYRGASVDGSAWETGRHLSACVRGGSWHSRPTFCRSASRAPILAVDADPLKGFRLVLGPPHP